MSKPDSLAIQPFTLASLKAALGMGRVDASPTEVSAAFSNLRAIMDEDLAKGFFVGVGNNRIDGHRIVYNRRQGKTNFMLTRLVLDGNEYNESLNGKYNLEGGNSISITAGRPMNSPLANCYVFLNDALVAKRFNPFDWAAEQTHSFVWRLNSMGSEAAITADRSPFPFVLKMLRDYRERELDMEKTRDMFEKMRRKAFYVTWERDFYPGQ